MKKFLKIVWIIFAVIIAFLVIVFVIVWLNTSWIDEKANKVISEIQNWNIEQLYSEINSIEKANNIKNGLTLEDLKNAIILPNGKADLRTIKNVVWNGRGFENSMKYIEWDWELDNWIKIHLRLEFIEKDWEYVFFWINWKAI